MIIWATKFAKIHDPVSAYRNLQIMCRGGRSGEALQITEWAAKTCIWVLGEVLSDRRHSQLYWEVGY